MLFFKAELDKERIKEIKTTLIAFERLFPNSLTV